MIELKIMKIVLDVKELDMIIMNINIIVKNVKNIYVLYVYQNLKYAHIFSYEENNYTQPLLILLNENFNHFNIIYDIEEYDNSNVFSTHKEELLKGTMHYEKLESKSKKIPELKNNNSNKALNNSNKGEEIFKQKESKKSAVKYKYDPNNPYLKYI